MKPGVDEIAEVFQRVLTAAGDRIDSELYDEAITCISELRRPVTPDELIVLGGVANAAVLGAAVAKHQQDRRRMAN